MSLDPDPLYEPETEAPSRTVYLVVTEEQPTRSVYLVDILIVALLAAIVGCAVVALIVWRP